VLLKATGAWFGVSVIGNVYTAEWALSRPVDVNAVIVKFVAALGRTVWHSVVRAAGLWISQTNDPFM
jgi:hypothetical protein